MNEISALPANIVEWLKGRSELSEIKFLTEFPAIKKAVPLKNTTVAVGIDSMEIVDSFAENDEGILVKEEYCRQAKIKLRLSIHAPYSSGGEACHDAFTDVIDCLTFASGLEIITSGCDGIVSDRDTDAFVLSAWATVNASLCPAASSELDFPSFLSKELLCGSHISDSAIHLSTEQQEYLTSPFKSGSYFGTGDSTETISVGFKPSVVVVVGSGMPLVYYNSSDSKYYAPAAFGVEKGSSLGLEITSKGFKVKNNVVSNGCTSLLNKLGTTYFYLAFK